MSFEKGHALVIGVGSYQHVPTANIPISVADARAVAELLRNPAYCGYPSEQVTLLHDEQASRDGILAALDALVNTSPEDTILLYYCGHGEYGEDDAYYLTTHDTSTVGNKVAVGSGISDAELLDKLRAIPAKRLLLLFNACHSGELSPHLGFGDEEKSFGDENLPQSTADALLSASEGLIIITAARPEQKSWIGAGQVTVFTQALLEGLRGEGDSYNNRGYVSAYGLYEHLYFAVKKKATAQGRTQEPELTVLKGVGPFPVSLYRGATSLGMFDDQQTLSNETAVRTVSAERSRRLADRLVINVGEGGVAAGRDISVGGDLVTGTQQTTVGNNIAQASGPDSHAEVNHSIFDQRGQQVGTQNNIAGDYHHTSSSDTFNVSGDFRGAMVNVKSTLDNVTQTINTVPNLTPSLKDELAGLIEELKQELTEAPQDKAEAAVAVSEMAQQVIDTATAEKPNRTMIKVTAEGLKQAAQSIADVLPSVLTIATRIVAAVTGLAT